MSRSKLAIAVNHISHNLVESEISGVLELYLHSFFMILEKDRNQRGLSWAQSDLALDLTESSNSLKLVLFLTPRVI